VVLPVVKICPVTCGCELAKILEQLYWSCRRLCIFASPCALALQIFELTKVTYQLNKRVIGVGIFTQMAWKIFLSFIYQNLYGVSPPNKNSFSITRLLRPIWMFVRHKMLSPSNLVALILVFILVSPFSLRLNDLTFSKLILVCQEKHFTHH
jgi:hypothetical protein